MNSRPVVMIATGTMNAGGAETLIMELLRHKTDRLNYVLLIHYVNDIEKGIYDDEIRQLGIPIYYIHSVGSVGELKYIKEFKSICDKLGKIDIIHCHQNAIAGIICKAASKVGIPIRISHCHADIKFKGSPLKITINEIKLFVMKMFIKQYATDYWACSKSAGVRLFGNKKNCVIIPNVISVNSYLPTKQKIENAKKKHNLESYTVIGSVGRIARIKNYEFVISLLKEYVKKDSNIRYVCFGRIVDNDYYDELKQMIFDNHLNEYCLFLGNSNDVYNDIQCIDVFLMPSYSEGFGMAALEAQAAGIPTIVSKGVPDIVDMGMNIVSFLTTDNVALWIQKIKQNANNRLMDTDYIKKHFTVNGYDSEKQVQEIENLYLSLLKRD